MPAAKLDLYAEQGVTFKRPLNISTNGQSADLTGHIFYGQICPQPGGPITSNLTVVVQDQTTAKGDVLISMTAAQTAALPVRRSPIGDLVLTELRYDVVQIYPNGDSERILEGKFTVSPSVTRIQI